MPRYFCDWQTSTGPIRDTEGFVALDDGDACAVVRAIALITWQRSPGLVAHLNVRDDKGTVILSESLAHLVRRVVH